LLLVAEVLLLLSEVGLLETVVLYRIWECLLPLVVAVAGKEAVGLADCLLYPVVLVEAKGQTLRESDWE
tara:strand:+ start:225 stop:431 length:207 start_codon:yes stop_codon:yes gene_type:complete